MLHLVWERRPTYNNASDITEKSMTTYLKLVYYMLFAIAYGMIGSLADLVMVNSSWTYDHILNLWIFARRRTHVVFPPCDIESLLNLNSNDRQRKAMILSIGQFRPEKDHKLQIRAFASMQKLATCNIKHNARLVLVGSCRGKEDMERVVQLRQLTDDLGVTQSVDFVLNQPFSILKEYLSNASVGLHTMWNEHFGIGVVEMMAAGLITIAHNSGGPKSDIIVPYTDGYLASTEEEYAVAMNDALDGLSSEKKTSIRRYAQESSKRFSDDVFTTSFKELISTII